MRNRKGFTLIELMIVVLIVAVLAAVLIPMISARIEAAKWSEGKAGAGTIATAIRAYAAEKGTDGTYPPTVDSLFKTGELLGKYFVQTDYVITSCTYNEASTPPLQYLITVTPAIGASSWKIKRVTLNHLGVWIEYAS